MAPAPQLYTVGHSNYAFERLLALLRAHGVAAVADVRTAPFSRFVPHFNRAGLARHLPEHGLRYVFLGRELGGKPLRQDPPATRLPYARRVQEPAFRDGIARLLELAGRQRTALLCRERDPLDCHRLHLIGRHVRSLVELRHILPDGSLETQGETERRLLARFGGAPALPLFEAAGAGEDERLARAYDAAWPG